MPPRAAVLLRLYQVVMTVVSLAAIGGGWYLISRDQQEQQTIREQSSRIQFRAPGP